MHKAKTYKAHRLAEQLASGATVPEAAALLGYSETYAVQLARTKLVKRAVEELHLLAKERAVMQVQEMLEYIANIVRTPIGEVDETSPLCQEYTVKETKNGTEKRYKMPGKLDAIKTAAQIVGTVGADTHVNLTQINNTLVEHGGKEFDPDLEERRVKTTVKNWKRDARERLGIGEDVIAV